MSHSFRTELNVENWPIKIKHGDGIFLMGSCFAEHIATALAECGHNINANPYGIIFNPYSIVKILKHVHDLSMPTDDLLLWQKNNLFVHGFYHSRVHHRTKYGFYDLISYLNVDTLAALKKAKYIIITWGTSIVYKHILSQKIVANCHKQPQSEFEKLFLDTDDLFDAFCEIIELYHIINPQLEWITTVSPIRYIKEGLINNNRSKARLILLAEKLTNRYDQFHYFPAYEMILDDLRDYRFFNQDMIHPSPLAIDYVWSKFAAACMDKNTQALNNEVRQLHKIKNHKTMWFDPSLDIRVAKQQLEEIQKLSLRHPEIDVQDLNTFWQNKLQSTSE